ncbi:MAG: tRNA (adenosine(37)-N6)-threonylcarbamoyltransferase complex ATPase subunit type 1 TsaE [Defluviitaleaceae bacterium]|nr:tRNA (adenosine(37)-N6)-threonylcarbamoyltransferase complex ATPase subunit type 1 TsaE [Defluviitaleaceae bacterium]
MVYRLNDANETEMFAQEFSRSIKAGDIICLSGGLGAGKTVFTKGLARGLGYLGRVTSPTFTLMNVYEGGRLTVYHFDLYRLDGEADIESVGCEEFFNAGGVCVLEWPEQGKYLFEGTQLSNPIRRLEIKTFFERDINYREIIIHENIGD